MSNLILGLTEFLVFIDLTNEKSYPNLMAHTTLTKEKSYPDLILELDMPAEVCADTENLNFTL